ncbi:MAG: HtrA protease/chaperone protein, partial [uncultured Thermomicrobiales bacterium]
TIVTANHIVERDEEITITTHDGRELPAKLAGRDPGSDLAVLRVEGAGLTPAPRAVSGDVKVGGLVLALGRAGSLAATLGVVSAVGGPWEGGRGRRFAELISTDAPMFPGFSGGPLIDVSGRVVGLLSSHLGRGQTLAIPAVEVDNLAGAIQSHGRVRRGYLGIGAQPVALPATLKGAAGLTQDHGLLLVTVEDDGPAAKAGLTIGDIVVQLGSTAVEGLDDLRAALGPAQVGQALTARILRGGQAQDVAITVGEAK